MSLERDLLITARFSKGIAPPEPKIRHTSPAVRFPSQMRILFSQWLATVGLRGSCDFRGEYTVWSQELVLSDRCGQDSDSYTVDRQSLPSQTREAEKIVGSLGRIQTQPQRESAWRVSLDTHRFR